MGKDKSNDKLRGANSNEAYPSMPVEILGNSSAYAGAEFVVTEMKMKQKIVRI